MMPPMVAPQLSVDKYFRLYRMRKQASTMTTAALKWFDQNIFQLLNPSEEKIFSLLSIGCGEGDIDIPLIETISKNLKKFNCKLHYTGLEPNPLQYQAITTKIQEISFENDVIIDIQPLGFCQYKGFSSLKRYHLILMSHVLYYFSDPYAALRSALTITRSNGHVLIVQQTQTGIPEIQKKIMRTIKGNENELLTAEDLKFKLDQSQYPYQYIEIPAFLDASECLKKTDTGVGIMSFCLECDLEKADKNTLNKAHQAFVDHCGQNTTETNSKILEPIGIFMIQPQPQRTKKQYILPLPTDNDPVSDYRVLANHYDWQQLIINKMQKKSDEELNILDVACGTGRWFQAFQHYILSDKTIQGMLNDINLNHSIRYHFLDPSESSLKKAFDRTVPILKKGNQYISKIQNFSSSSTQTFDIIWMMHGFYNIPRNDIKQSIQNMISMLSEEGSCVIVQSGRNAFYIDFFDHCCDCLNIKSATSFTCAEDILDVLSEMGISYDIQIIEYNECIDANQEDKVCHYLFQESINNSFIRDNHHQEGCLPDPLDLSIITKNNSLDHYIQSCFHDGNYLFPQNVWLIFIRRS